MRGPSSILTAWSCLFDDSCWSFLMSFHISPEVIFGRIPIERTFFVHTSAKIIRNPKGHWFSWFLMIFGYFWNITKAEALGNSTWMKKPAFKTNRWVPPAESGCTTATLSCSWVVFSSVSFYLEKAPWKPWPPWIKPVANKKKFILASPKKGEANIWTCETLFFFAAKKTSFWKEHESTRLV